MQCAPLTEMQRGVGCRPDAQVQQRPGTQHCNWRRRPLPKDTWHHPGYRAVSGTPQESLESRCVEPSPVAGDTCSPQEQQLVALIEAIAGGDTQALAALYNATSTPVYSLALRIVQDQSVAEEVVIEVYMQVQRLAATYASSRGTPSAWLLTLTRSRAIDRWRVESPRQQREAPLEMALHLPAPAADPEVSSIAAELRQAVQAALLALRPEQRQVIEIAYYAGLSHSEIAARLHLPLGTVKSRLRTAMLLLRDLLQPLLEVGEP